MKINRNAHVTVSYELRLNGVDGEMVEQTEANAPLEFVFGAGKMLEMFEQKLEGLAAGDAFQFELKAEEAYGELDPNAVVDLPKDIFAVNGSVEEGLLEVGNQIPMQDSHGNRMTGIVLELEEDIVKMDFNHPLAGEDLFFKGKVIGVREASEDELVACCGSDCDSECGSGGCGCSCGH